MTGDPIADLLETIKDRTSPAALSAHRKETTMTTSHPSQAGGQPTDDAPVERYAGLLFDAARMWAERAAEAEANAKLMRGRSDFYLGLANKQQAIEQQEEQSRGAVPGDQDLRVLQAAAAATGIPAPPAATGHITDQSPSSAARPDVQGPAWASNGIQ